MQIQLLPFSVVLFFFIGFAYSSFGQIPNMDDFVVTHFGMEDGVPQNSINEILQTEDGYIWIATFGGLARFDGNRFTKFNRSNTTCMVSDQVLDIYADSEGAIWLFPAHANTLITKINNEGCNTYKLGNGVSSRVGIIEDFDGSIWAYAFNEFFFINEEGIQKVELVNDPTIRKEAIKSKNGTWFGVNKSIYRIYKGSIVMIWDNISDIDSSINYLYEHPQKEGRILVVTSGSIVEFELGEELTKVTTNPVSDIALDLKFDNNNNQYVTTVNGLGVKINSSFERLNPFKEQEAIRAKSFLQDNEGNYWIGTEGDGLFQFRKKTVSMIDKDDGLKNEKMLSITTLKDGKILMSTNCDGIYEWEDGKARLSAIHDYIDKGCYWSVFQDSRGRIWIGGESPYMTESLDTPGRFFGHRDGYDGYSIFAITEDSKKRIWVATTTGIFIYNGNSFTEKLTEENGLFYKDARTLYEDTSGKMWIGTNGGLNTYKDKKVEKVNLIINEGSETSSQPHVRAIHEDEDGIFWIGTYGDGLFRIKNGELFHFNTNNGLYDNVVSHIIEDENGFFWMGSNNGIHRTGRESLNKLADGEIERVTSFSYSTKDGMNSAETNGGFQPSFIYSSDKNIYFPTVAGVAKVSTKEINGNSVLSPVYIETIKNSKAEDIGGLQTKKLELSYDEAFLEINYTAINFTDPDKVRFRYRLKGLNDSWVEAGSRREAIYTKIPSGEYTFEVIAANSDGVWNNEGALLSITVTPPFWNTGWFYTVIGLLIIGGVGLFYYRRVENLKEENEIQKRFSEQLIDSQEQERRRIASELHDGLGQQILVIKNRVELAKKKTGNIIELEEELDEIMQSAVISISDVRSISHGLRPVHLEKFGLTEAIENLCEELQNTLSIEWSYHIENVDEAIQENKQIHFYRVIQEGVKNIIKHSSAKEASVLIKRTENTISVTIWDDGKGFDLKTNGISEGLGFLGMRERIQSLGGIIDIQSVLINGTTIKIEIPIDEYEK